MPRELLIHGFNDLKIWVPLRYQVIRGSDYRYTARRKLIFWYPDVLFKQCRGNKTQHFDDETMRRVSISM